jgi:predicted nucleic acid-binding protein
MAIPRFYWDTSCFLSYLSPQHPDEQQRALICRDILQHAQNDRVELWTSAWTIVETIRPKKKYEPIPLPAWSEALNQADDEGKLLYPGGVERLTEIWEYYTRHTVPTRKLTADEIGTVRSLFTYPFIRIVQIEQAIANQASQIALEKNMRPGDALHVASAISRKCDCIQRWDRDYTRSDDLITSEEPQLISTQTSLYLAGSPARSLAVRGSDGKRAEGEATGEAAIAPAQAEVSEKRKAADEGGPGESGP